MFARCASLFVALGCSAILNFGTSELRAQGRSNQLGIFEAQTDVGIVTPPGTLAYDPAKGIYTISSAGENLWSTVDAFHFVWKKVSGDVALTAEMNFPDSSGNPNPHRKTLLMFRQTLDADGVYADAAQHGSGLMGLQYRTAKGATTQDIELTLEASPRRVRLEKRGDIITMFLSMGTEPLHQVGASIRMHLDEPFYAGIGVCSHNKDVVERATFAHVELTPLTAPSASSQKVLYTTLQTVGIEDNFRRALVVASERGRMEAPNWSRDGKTLIFNRDGHIWTIGAEGGKATMVETGAATKCTGSHGLSTDGKLLAISCSMPGKPETRVYIIPSGGGEPRLLTENPWSYFHSWSPDGKTIAFTRPDFKGGGNILTIPVAGGTETALTTGSGVSDDPDYSADGKYIYFNSDRGGSMQIWRMRPDGSEPEQITNDAYSNWTPHPSPDGKSILILSYENGETSRTADHPADKNISFRILNVADAKIRVLVRIIGGAGSDNVPNWAPDGLHFAFVSSQMLPAEENGSTE